jgi:hypothetical protein
MVLSSRVIRWPDVGAAGTMDELALTDDEWDAIHWAARGVTAATEAGDAVGRATRYADLRAILSQLRDRHGDHPKLFEMEADFTLDVREAADLYVLAERAAVERGLPTITIRLSLAKLLLEEMKRPIAARATLVACQEELPMATDAQCAIWAALLAACPAEPEPAPAAEPSPDIGTPPEGNGA